MLILAIDTSGHTASAALLEDSTLRAQVSLYTLRTHSQVMLPLCRQLLDNAGVTLEEIDLFAVADGPGSYTGLRIGISAVKGMAFALGKPCAGISTLEGMAYNLLGTRGTLCCAIHARQQLHYCGIFSSDGREVTRLTEDAILPQEHLLEQLRTGSIELTIDAEGLSPGDVAYCTIPDLGYKATVRVADVITQSQSDSTTRTVRLGTPVWRKL